ncbi:MAG: hypothetical protein WBW73_05965 [Rhodoplanes sp.]
MVDVNSCRKVIARDRAGHHQNSHATSDAWQRLLSGNDCRSVHVPRGTLTTAIPALLRNPRHEAVAHALVQEMSCREAGLAAGYKDGPGLKGNISRLRHSAVMRERIAEIAARAGELAEVYDAWILSRIKALADSTLASFVRCEDGKLVLDERGYPIIDFSHATPEQMRTLAVLENDQSGRLRLKLRDPVRYLELLAPNRGLLRDKVVLTDSSAERAAQVYLVSDKPLTEYEWAAAFVRSG